MNKFIYFLSTTVNIPIGPNVKIIDTKKKKIQT